MNGYLIFIGSYTQAELSRATVHCEWDMKQQLLD